MFLAIYIALGVCVVWFVIVKIIEATEPRSFTVQCDMCGRRLTDADLGAVTYEGNIVYWAGYKPEWWKTQEGASEMAKLVRWYVGEKGHYCPSCVSLGNPRSDYAFYTTEGDYSPLGKQHKGLASGSMIQRANAGNILNLTSPEESPNT